MQVRHLPAVCRGVQILIGCGRATHLDLFELRLDQWKDIEKPRQMEAWQKYNSSCIFRDPDVRERDIGSLSSMLSGHAGNDFVRPSKRIDLMVVQKRVQSFDYPRLNFWRAVLVRNDEA